jgi:hypothetical protein
MTISSLAIFQLVPFDRRQAAVLAHLFDLGARCLARLAAGFRLANGLAAASPRRAIFVAVRSCGFRIQVAPATGSWIVTTFSSPLASVTSWRVRPALSR